ncbi:hypothetical protein [Rhodococcus koreensis]|uniref:Uncharacterized protein n=1 Tax=Rhodococcus koreensis TaxID=99653 RepID=A0A1H4NB49_9NOCA|nr:hypothetical protein [Rhodococcus koreensis]SEB92085.1 hypothetical protein SAMN04490239_2189 [Rhodococcus koreensis]
MTEVFLLGAVLSGGIGFLGLAVALFGGAEPNPLCASTFDGRTEVCDDFRS